MAPLAWLLLLAFTHYHPRPPLKPSARRVCRSRLVAASQSDAILASTMAVSLAETPADGKTWMKLASLARKNRDLVSAERILTAAVKCQPTNSLLWQALADTQRESGRYSAARTLYRRTLALNESLGSAYHAWGRMEATLGNAEAAQRILEKGLSRGLPRPNARLAHALAILLDGTLGRTDEARVLLKDALQAEPSNPQLLHALGLLEANAGNTPAARRHLASAQRSSNQVGGASMEPIPSAPERQGAYWQASHALARLEMENGNPTLAKQICASALPATGGAVQLFQFLANLEQRTSRPSAARQVYLRATAEHSGDERLWLQWARMEEGLGYLSRAAELYEKAIEAKPSNADAYTRFATMLVRTQEVVPKWAGQFGGKVPERGLLPGQKTALVRGIYEQGASACSRGAMAAVGSEARRLSKLLHSWAAWEWKQGDRTQARLLFSRAAALAPREQKAWVFQWYARFEADCGNELVARHLLAKAVNADRFDGSTWRFWAELEEQAGNRALAQELNRHAALQEATKTLLFRRQGGGRASEDGGPSLPQALGTRGGGRN